MKKEGLFVGLERRERKRKERKKEEEVLQSDKCSLAVLPSPYYRMYTSTVQLYRLCSCGRKDDSSSLLSAPVSDTALFKRPLVLPLLLFTHYSH